MGSVVLEGAPDDCIAGPGSGSKGVQVMHLDMSADFLDDLLNSLRRSKTSQIQFGKNPLIKYDGKTHELRTKPERFRHELYSIEQQKGHGKWQFHGLVNHSIIIQDAEKAAAGTDRALEALKSTMASIEQEREARKTVISTPEVRSGKVMSKAAAKASHLKPLTGKISPASPSVGATTPAHLRPPTSAGLDMPHEYAIKKALTHYLAVQPRSYLQCRRMAHCNPKKVLEKMARETNKTTEEWTLQDRAYKDLDVWDFSYPAEDRKTAIDNAIKAFDRMRLSKDDPNWQKLLPKESRGQGIVLSKLHLKDPSVGTPSLKAQGFGKNGLPKRKDPKKPEKSEKLERPEKPEKAEKTDKAGTETVRSKKAKSNGREEKPNAAKSVAEARTPKVEPRKERQPTKRTMAKPANGTTPDGKTSRTTVAAKGLLNKPKNPSPLGASPSVNASDFEDTHPVHKKLSAATSPRRDLKRKAEEISGKSQHINGVSKRPHAESCSFNSSSSSDDRPLKSNSTTSGNDVNGHATNGNISPSSDSSSSDKPLALSWRQSLEMARKFNLYYQRYKKLYTELSQSVEPPSERKREELLEMHRRLQDMKRRVNRGAV